MNFIEAITLAKDNKPVRRKYWDEGLRLIVNFSSAHHNNEYFIAHLEKDIVLPVKVIDILATDWELVDSWMGKLPEWFRVENQVIYLDMTEIYMEYGPVYQILSIDEYEWKGKNLANGEIVSFTYGTNYSDIGRNWIPVSI